MTRYLEILGQSVPVPDPDSVAILSGQYRAVATTIGDAKSQLAGIGTGQAQAIWAGQAASAFSRKLGELPGQLEQALQSYTTVAWALSGYADGLRPVVAALSSLAYQAEEAEGTLRATVNARNQVIAQGHDPVATGWNTRVSEAQAEVAQLDRRLSALLAELEGLSAQCVREIQQAEHEGISNNLISDFQRYIVQDGGVVLDDAFTVADDLLVKPFTDFYEALERWASDPTWATFGAALDACSHVLELVAVLLAPIPGAYLVLTLASVVAGVLGGASDAAAAAEHEPGASWGQVRSDAIDLGLTALGGVFGKGAEASDSLMRGAVDQGDLGQLEALADGSDARVSAGALWGDGIKNYFSLDGWTPDPSEAGQGVLDTYKDEAYTFLHAGADGYTNSPAAAMFQHLEWSVDGIKAIKEVLDDQAAQARQGS